MIYEVVITKQADADLRAIYEYIAFELLSPDNAAGQLERLEKSIFEVQDFPEKFKKYEKEPWYSRGLHMRPVELKLILATEKDAELIHQLKYEAFLPLYNKYHDDATSPVMEFLDNVLSKITRKGSDYYIIQLDGENIGGVRVADCVGNREFEEGVFYISPIFILPKFQNRGLGFAVIQKVFEMYDHAKVWRLDTILQEKANCHLYEKCGFVRVGEEKVINEFMTLIDYEKIVER